MALDLGIAISKKVCVDEAAAPFVPERLDLCARRIKAAESFTQSRGFVFGTCRPRRVVCDELDTIQLYRCPSTTLTSFATLRMTQWGSLRSG